MRLQNWLDEGTVADLSGRSTFTQGIPAAFLSQRTTSVTSRSMSDGKVISAVRYRSFNSDRRWSDAGSVALEVVASMPTPAPQSCGVQYGASRSDSCMTAPSLDLPLDARARMTGVGRLEPLVKFNCQAAPDPEPPFDRLGQSAGKQSPD